MAQSLPCPDHARAVILIAFALCRLRPRAVQAGVLAAVLALSAVNVHPKIRAPAVEDLPGGAEMLLQASRPTDAVVYSGAATRTPFHWVLQEQAGDRPLPRDVAVAPDGLPHEVGDLYAREVDARVLTRRLERCERVWVVSLPGSRWHPTPEPMQEVQRSAFWREHFQEVSQRDFGGLRIERYDNERAASARPRRVRSADVADLTTSARMPGSQGGRHHPAKVGAAGTPPSPYGPQPQAAPPDSGSDARWATSTHSRWDCRDHPSLWRASDVDNAAASPARPATRQGLSCGTRPPQDHAKSTQRVMIKRWPCQFTERHAEDHELRLEY
ncbi:MAG: hypothetical protein M3P89_15000 [Actinomycetota bacterium]|nr:hypothetical protein [Actinomycetota bacterium]